LLGRNDKLEELVTQYS